MNVATVVTSVGVGLDIDVGLNECSIVGQMEFDVFDSKSSAEPLLLVVGFDFQYVVGDATVVEVGRIHLCLKVIDSNQFVGVGVEKRADDDERAEDAPQPEGACAEAVVDTAAGKLGADTGGHFVVPDEGHDAEGEPREQEEHQAESGALVKQFQSR